MNTSPLRHPFMVYGVLSPTTQPALTDKGVVVLAHIGMVELGKHPCLINGFLAVHTLHARQFDLLQG